jgi:hypothetical protein
MRAKEQTLSRQKRREARGTREARGASFPGTAERPLQRKQVFAAALKRINKELERLHNLAARTAHVEAARQALALRRAANFIPYPSAGATASEGMLPHPSRRRKTIIEGAKIGRISEATKIAQAVRDTRGDQHFLSPMDRPPGLAREYVDLEPLRRGGALQHWDFLVRCRTVMYGVFGHPSSRPRLPLRTDCIVRSAASQGGVGAQLA